MAKRGADALSDSGSPRKSPRKRQNAGLRLVREPRDEEEWNEEETAQGHELLDAYTDEYDVARAHAFELRNGADKPLVQLIATELVLSSLREGRTGYIYEALDAIDDEFQQFSVELFDPRAKLLRKIYIGAERGNAAFRHEVDRAPSISMIERIEVKDPANLRKGYATEALKQLFEHETFSRVAFCFATARRNETTLHFLRSCGFRRVGSTNWLCWARDPQHASRQIEKQADYNPQGQLFPDQPTNGPIDPEQAAIAFPLHSAIVNSLGRREAPSPIAALSVAGRAQLDVADDGGMTPLHVAIESGAYKTALEILQLPDAARYAAAQTQSGKTCLQLLRDSKQNSFAFMLAFALPTQGGSNDDATRAEARLKALLPPEPAQSSCTCGRCIDGWLSPRTRSLLIAGAEIASYSMQGELDSFTKGVPLDEYEFDGSFAYEHFPKAMRKRGIYKTTYRAFADQLEAIVDVLSRPNRKLTLDAIQGEACTKPFGASDFFARGGSMRNIVEAVIEYARTDPGDVDTNDERDADWDAEGVPRCANDEDWDLLREKLIPGYDRRANDTYDREDDEDEPEGDESDQESDESVDFETVLRAAARQMAVRR